MTTISLASLILVLVLDVFLSAARSVIGKIHFIRQLQNFREKSRQADRVHSLLDNYFRVDTGLKIVQMIARFIAAGFLLLFISHDSSPDWIWWYYLSLFGGALLLAVLEWAASIIVVKGPEGWALKMSGGIWIINRFVSPLVTFLFLFARDLEEA